MEPRRVVVTGLGVLSPVGNDRKTAWPAVREGRSGIGEITGFDTTDFEVRIAGEVRDFDAERYVSKRESRRFDRYALFAMAAAHEAITASGLLDGEPDLTRVGTFIGTGIGGLNEIETQHMRLIQGGPRRVSALMIPKLMTNAAAGQISIRYGFQGPSMSVSSACASGSNSIGEAFHSVRYGRVDAQVCGGAEAAVTAMGVSGFIQLKALSTRNDEPTKASRPFSIDRDGFVIAEGAAVLVIEALEHAKARGARILGEIVGYGGSSDSYHMTAPDPEGRGAVAAMQRALADASLNPEDVSYINAHGTSTPAGDDIECRAISTVFGPHAPDVAVSSSKSVFGHLLGASGALESAVCIWALQDDVCPPTINLDRVDPECGNLNLVPNTAQERPLHCVMNNSFGFGGHNVSLVLKKFTG